LTGITNDVPNRELLLEELIMLWLEVENPALENYSELFNEKIILPGGAGLVGQKFGSASQGKGLLKYGCS